MTKKKFNDWRHKCREKGIKKFHMNVDPSPDKQGFKRKMNGLIASHTSHEPKPKKIEEGKPAKTYYCWRLDITFNFSHVRADGALVYKNAAFNRTIAIEP